MKQCKPVTRRMVAEEAGVSETIVSYVINNNRYVDAEKRRNVNTAIKKLGYRPNAIARSLKLKRSKHILFLADRIDNEHFGKLIFEMDRVLYDKGYLDAAAELDLSVDAGSVVSRCANTEAVRERIAAILRSGRKVDGVFARNDRLAAIAIQAIKEEGLSIPGDIAVIGFDNSELSRYTHPTLTTMEIDRRGVAGEAAAAIVGMIEGGKPAPATMKTTLIVRESTRS